MAFHIFTWIPHPVRASYEFRKWQLPVGLITQLVEGTAPVSQRAWVRITFGPIRLNIFQACVPHNCDGHSYFQRKLIVIEAPTSGFFSMKRLLGIAPSSSPNLWSYAYPPSLPCQCSFNLDWQAENNVVPRDLERDVYTPHEKWYPASRGPFDLLRLLLVEKR